MHILTKSTPYFGSEDPKPKFVRAQDGKQDSQIHLIQAKVNYSPLLNSTFYGYLMISKI